MSAVDMKQGDILALLRREGRHMAPTCQRKHRYPPLIKKAFRSHEDSVAFHFGQ